MNFTPEEIEAMEFEQPQEKENMWVMRGKADPESGSEFWVADFTEETKEEILNGLLEFYHQRTHENKATI